MSPSVTFASLHSFRSLQTRSTCWTHCSRHALKLITWRLNIPLLGWTFHLSFRLYLLWISSRYSGWMSCKISKTNLFSRFSWPSLWSHYSWWTLGTKKVNVINTPSIARIFAFPLEKIGIFRITFTANVKRHNDHATMFVLYLALAVFCFPLKNEQFFVTTKDYFSLFLPMC